MDVLSEKSVSIYSGENSNVGNGGWWTYTITFEKPFSVVPFVSIMGTTWFSNENICLDEVTVNGMRYSVYEPTTTFNYGTRWMAIGY